MNLSRLLAAIPPTSKLRLHGTRFNVTCKFVLKVDELDTFKEELLPLKKSFL